MDTNNASATQDTNTAAQNTASTPTQTGAANPGSTEAKFTQADLDRLLNERIERSEKRDAKIKADLLKQLGLAEDADFNTLKSTIVKARDIEQANLSAAEKAEKAAEVALKRATDLEAQLNAERNERRNDRIASHVQAKARDLKANDKAVDDVLRYARDTHSEALNAVMDADGKVDDAKVTALVEKIKAEKAHYFTAILPGAGVPSNSGGRATLDIDAKHRQRGALNTRQQIKSGF